MTYNEAENYLKSYKRARTKVNAYKSRYEEVFKSQGVVSFDNDGTTSGTHTNHSEELDITLAQLHQEYLDAVKEKDIQLNKILTVSKLCSPKCQEIISYLFICCYSWDKVAEVMGCTRENVAKSRRRAIKQFRDNFIYIA